MRVERRVCFLCFSFIQISKVSPNTSSSPLLRNHYQPLSFHINSATHWDQQMRDLIAGRYSNAGGPFLRLHFLYSQISFLYYPDCHTSHRISLIRVCLYSSTWWPVIELQNLQSYQHFVDKDSGSHEAWTSTGHSYLFHLDIVTLTSLNVPPQDLQTSTVKIREIF